MANKLNLGEFRILLAIYQGAKYGLEVRDRVSEMIRKQRPVSLGGVYTVLHSLEKKKWVRGQWADDEQARLGARRRNYSLTSAGRQMLAQASDEMRLMLAAAPPSASSPSGSTVPNA